LPRPLPFVWPELDKIIVSRQISNSAFRVISDYAPVLDKVVENALLEKLKPIAIQLRYDSFVELLIYILNEINGFE
jgi:hypothetical protein